MTQEQPRPAPDYESLMDPDLRFEKCTSGPRPAPLTYLRMAGEGRQAGCENTQPWWTNVWAFIPASAALAFWCATNRLSLLDTITSTVMLMLIWLTLVRLLNPRRSHHVCHLCGLCSVSDGVHPARTRKASITNARRNGWTVDPTTNRAHCRGHAEVPFIHTTGAAS